MRTSAAKRKGQALHAIVRGRKNETEKRGGGKERFVVTVVLGWREYVLILLVLLLMLLICLRMVA